MRMVRLLSSAAIFGVLMFCSCSNGYKIKTSELTVSLSDDGQITAITAGPDKIEKPVNAFTAIAGCRQEGKTVVQKTDDGGVWFERTLVCDSSKKSCVLIEKFIPTENSVRWETEIVGKDGGPWASVIQTKVRYPAQKNGTLFWTAWGTPQYDTLSVGSTLSKKLKVLSTGKPGPFFHKKVNSWVDPLVPVPFSNATYDYGAPRFQYSKPTFRFVPYIFCIPMVTVIEPSAKFGLTFGLSPEDEIIDLTMTTSASGDIAFDRYFNRISAEHPCKFSLDITAHADDWRPALAWMTKRYPAYFNPVNPEAHLLGGTGAYSNHFADFDAEKMEKMCFTVNWQASFDFPYMGMFLSPVGPNEQWTRFSGGKITVKAMNDYAAEMKRQGFYVFNYFNVTEFGTKIKYPAPPRSTKDDKDLWKDSNDYLYVKLPGGILPRPDSCVTKPEYMRATPPEPWYTWEGAIAMDCGDPAYRDFLLNQARRHVTELPDAFGICIDRMDWLRYFNERADDGIAWFGGKPVRSVVTSWKQLMDGMGPIFHDAGKFILVNNHVKRIDVLNHVDGIFDEFTYAGVPLNTTALLCVNKPALGWTDTDATVKKEGGDTFFQKYLYMGIFPMCPFPGNDHSIHPDPEVDQIYLDYGPLMQLMKSRVWVLEPHAISVENDLAKANIFKIPEGYSVPVVYGEESQVRVKIANVDEINNKTTCSAYYPGKETPAELKLVKDGSSWYMDVPLERGCAMIKLSIDN